MRPVKIGPGEDQPWGNDGWIIDYGPAPGYKPITVELQREPVVMDAGGLAATVIIVIMILLVAAYFDSKELKRKAELREIKRSYRRRGCARRNYWIRKNWKKRAA